MPLFSPSRLLRAASHPNSAPDWSKTLHLPKSTFPARPPPAKLEEYRRRCADDLYTWQRAHRPSGHSTASGEADDEFVLHDGPPYANGAVHVGHALNKILKDLILRSELARGRRVRYRPGWDCHGLPIELKALQQRRAPAKQSRALEDAPEKEAKAAVAGSGLSDGEIRRVAQELASQTVEEQKSEFRSWAVMGEWDQPYRTMDRDFEVRQLGVFKEMVKNGLIFRDYRPVYWSPSSRTALAEAELEYDDKHRCTAAFVKMPLVQLPTSISDHEGVANHNIYALIWTTTPWTLPANRAVAVKDDILYSLSELFDSAGHRIEGLYIIGQERVEHVQSFLPEGWRFAPVVKDITGAELSSNGAACLNVFNGEQSPILTADFVTANSGTGLVHTAPGHGMEDYQLCQQNGISSAFAPVDDAARFTSDAFPLAKDSSMLTGLDVQTDGTKTVINIMSSPQENFQSEGFTPNSSLILAAHDFVHKYPIDWRTKKPVIIRSTAQWFANVSHINQRALAALDDVAFIPESGETRLRAFIQGRSQWCISRQRAWGVPIPVLYHRTTDKECYSDEVIEHIISVVRDRGTDAWFTDPPDDPAWIAPSLEPGEWIRKRDTMDVWFDSGTSWTSLPAQGGGQVSDVCVEGTDQHRGWFQSSLLTAISTQDAGEPQPKAPYRKVITHGFTLDGNGRKMSKSLGNVISPSAVISGSLLAVPDAGKKNSGSTTSSKKRKQDPLGPDLLRLWAASSDYTKDVSISQPALQGLQQAMQKYRVTFRFLLGVLADFQPPTPTDFTTSLPSLTVSDRIVLLRLAQRSAAIFAAYRAYRFSEAAREINAFVTADLSAVYLEAAKDALYAGIRADRAAVQAVLHAVAAELLRWLAPVVPLLVEEVWEHMPPQLRSSQNADDGGETQHPLRRVWDAPFSPWSEGVAERVAKDAAVLEPLGKAVKTAQERARAAGKLGSGLACRVEISLPSGVWDDGFISDDGGGLVEEELRQALVVSELVLGDSAGLGGGETADVVSEGAEKAWRYEEAFEVRPHVEGEVLTGKAVVLPPSMQKCGRCWQYTAEDEGGLCGRCEDAVQEERG